MRLYSIIDDPLKEELAKQYAQTVSEIWDVFKKTIKISPLLKHEHVSYYGIESDYFIEEGKGFFRITFLYRLIYTIDGDEYEQTESNDLEFERAVQPGEEKIGESYIGGIYSDEYSLAQMFELLEKMDTFVTFKNEILEYNVYAQEA